MDFTGRATMPIALKALLQAQHLHSHSDFRREYDRCARELDPHLIGNAPTKAQYYKWLSGELQKLPRGAHCRVLEHMFPGWTAHQLFSEFNPDDLKKSPTAEEDETPLLSTSPGLGEFLGSEILTTGVTLAYPTFQLAPSVKTALEETDTPRQHHYYKPRSAFATNHRIDVPVAVAENDIRALIYILSMLERNARVKTNIANDHEVVEKCDRSFISFGLSSNDCTHMYLRQAREPLFTINDNNNASEYLEYIRTKDGKAFQSDSSSNIGIVMRTRPDSTLHPNRHWFYCAGLGPQGTPGASWFLAKNWQTLHERAGAHNFIAVVSVESYSDQTARLEHLYINKENDK